MTWSLSRRNDAAATFPMPMTGRSGRWHRRQRGFDRRRERGLFERAPEQQRRRPIAAEVACPPVRRVFRCPLARVRDAGRRLPSRLVDDVVDRASGVARGPWPRRTRQCETTPPTHAITCPRVPLIGGVPDARSCVRYAETWRSSGRVGGSRRVARLDSLRGFVLHAFLTAHFADCSAGFIQLADTDRAPDACSG